MSALNVFLTDEQVHMITDGAACTFGVLTLFNNKVLALPHLGIALGLRGNVAMTNRIRFILERFNAQEDALAALPKLMRKAFGVFTRALPRLFNFDIVVAGHRNGKPFALSMSSVSRDDREAFVWHEVEGAFISPPIGPADLSAASRAFAQGIDGAAVILLDAQRRGGLVPVGGFAQITSCTPLGIVTRVVKHYPDQRGLKIKADTGLTPQQPAGDWRNG